MTPRRARARIRAATLPDLRWAVLATGLAALAAAAAPVLAAALATR